MTVTSALTKLKPASTTRRYARWSSSSESASFQRGFVGGNMVPMSPRPAAPRMASVRACATASASECPARPRGWGISTPPRMSLRPPPSANRCESYPTPTRMSDLEDADRQVGGVLGVVDADACHRDTARRLRRGDQRVEAVERSDRERHADHGEVGERCREAGKRGGQTRARDDHLETAAPGPRDELRGLVGLAVCGGDAELVGHAGLGENVEGWLDPGFVVFGADEDQHVGHVRPPRR